MGLQHEDRGGEGKGVRKESREEEEWGGESALNGSGRGIPRRGKGDRLLEECEAGWRLQGRPAAWSACSRRWKGAARGGSGADDDALAVGWRGVGRSLWRL